MGSCWAKAPSEDTVCTHILRVALLLDQVGFGVELESQPVLVTFRQFSGTQ